MHRSLLPAFGLVLALLPACGGDDAATTTTGVPTTAAVTTTTGGGDTTTTTKPEDDRADGLLLAGGFQGGGAPPDVPTEPPAEGGYSGYYEATDDTGIITVNVPVEWGESLGTPWNTNIFGIDPGEEGIGPALSVSPDLDGWTTTWDVPGLFIGATTLYDGSLEDALDAYFDLGLGDECTYDARYEYDDGAYVGAVDWWYDCGGVDTAYAVIVARPPGGEFTVIVEITIVTEADLEAGDEIVASFYVTGLAGEAGGGALDTELEPNYGTGALDAGFEPDPQALPVDAGGDIDVSAYLGGDCAGFVTTNPDFEFTWSGSTGTLLRFFFVADQEGADTVLVINDPAGEWWCADDSFETFNPTIDFPGGPDGVYDVWVGTYSGEELIPGTLYITEVDGNHP